MKILAFSDVHCDHVACEALVAVADQADLIIGAGDFAQRREGLAETMAILQPFAAKAIYVAGNNETPEELRAATSAEVMASRGSMGSVEIRNTIERVQPRLMVCGHVHDCWGERGKIGQTKVANLGPSVNWIELEL